VSHIGLAPQGGGGGGSSGWVPVESKSASSSSEITFTGMTQTNVIYVVIAKTVIVGTDGDVLYLQTSSNNGSSYDSGASDYKSGGSLSTQITLTTTLGNDSKENVGFTCKIFNPSSTSLKKLITSEYVAWRTTGVVLGGAVTSARDSTSAINAIRIYASTGNIASGTFDLWYIPSI